MSQTHRKQTHFKGKTRHKDWGGGKGLASLTFKVNGTCVQSSVQILQLCYKMVQLGAISSTGSKNKHKLQQGEVITTFRLHRGVGRLLVKRLDGVFMAAQGRAD